MSKEIINFSKNKLMQELNSSLDVDKRLYKQDILASIAHVEMLAKQKIIKNTSAKKIISGLKTIEKEIDQGKFKFNYKLEDIHLNIEQSLKDKIGSEAGMMHTARSRNDQVVTDFRLWLREAHDLAISSLKELAKSLAFQIEKNGKSLMPGYTHLQVAQPICYGHHLLAYLEHILRDIERLSQSRKRTNASPLGAAALAGTSYPIDRKQTQLKLGFDSIMINSMDAVSSRDFVLEFLASLTIANSSLARLAEDLILWSSQSFDFIDLPLELSSQSSIMPQKKNPDAVELIRAKTTICQAGFSQLQQIVSRLPQSYFKDMQEDKKICFDSFDSFILITETLTLLFQKLKIKPDNMLLALDKGYPAATEIADFLTKKGMAFRDAYNIVKNLVVKAQKQKLSLSEVEKSYYHEIDEDLAKVYLKLTDNQRIVDSKNSLGGAAYKQVMLRLSTIKKLLKKI